LMDLDGVEILYGLKKIVADRCRLRSLAALVALPSLTSLSVRENAFSSVPDLLQVPVCVSLSVSVSCPCLCRSRHLLPEPSQKIQEASWIFQEASWTFHKIS